ncbi:MAG: peptidoglycan-associated lipoprotein Pal [SAR324 cluster bacterium]|nr:peptidoglycan-associated lipoprotein Pal [SAR324 cluster bacterium]
MVEQPPPPQPPLPSPDLVEPEEFDIEPYYEGAMVLDQVIVPPDEVQRGVDASLLPPPRALRSGSPPGSGESVADADDSVIFDKARQYEEELARVEAAPQPAAVTEFEVVYFDFDRSNIKPEFAAAIRNNAESLRADPNLTVLVEGHCDERGTTEYNLALGERRARAVHQALIAEGVSPGQLNTVSYGEERPAAFGHDESSWSLNRRSMITVR